VDVTIRRATPDDARTLVALWDEAYEHERSSDGVDLVERALGDDHLVCMVAVDAERVIGSLIAAFDGWRGNLYRLAVVPTYRRRGIARQLLAATEPALGDLGARRVTAIVDVHDDRAVGFWEAHGYGRDPDAVRHVGHVGPSAATT
jgi:ribosomal protein S18 acetylase RimI-like enzyme